MSEPMVVKNEPAIRKIVQKAKEEQERLFEDIQELLDLMKKCNGKANGHCE
jgi:hypothetical protein